MIHEGFKRAAHGIAGRRGFSEEERRYEREHGEKHESAETHAARILAARSRSASKAAHKKNPRLNRVKG